MRDIAELLLLVMVVWWSIALWSSAPFLSIFIVGIYMWGFKCDR